jgi:hypothetical protein
MAMRSRGALGNEMFGCGGALAAAALGTVDAMQLLTANADAVSRKVRRVIVVMVRESILLEFERQVKWRAGSYEA